MQTEIVDSENIITKDINSKNIDSEMSLVDTIEEFGFIPSLDNNDDINAA